MKRLIGGLVMTAVLIAAGPVQAGWVIVHGTAAQKINPDTFAGTASAFFDSSIDNYSTGYKIVPNKSSTVIVIVPIPGPVDLNQYLSKIKINFESDPGAKITEVEFFNGAVENAGLSNIQWYGPVQTKTVQPGGSYSFEKGLAIMIRVTGTTSQARTLKLYSVSALYLPK